MNPPASSTNLWPIAIISFFAVAITLIISFIVFATRQRMDLVRHDYYDDEMRFQQQIDRVGRTRPLGTEVSLAYDARQQRITLTLPAAHARRAVSGRIHFYRPSDASLDRDEPLTLKTDGTQQLDAKNLRAGLWKVRVLWKLDGQEYFFDQSIVVGAAHL